MSELILYTKIMCSRKWDGFNFIIQSGQSMQHKNSFCSSVWCLIVKCIKWLAAHAHTMCRLGATFLMMAFEIPEWFAILNKFLILDRVWRTVFLFLWLYVQWASESTVLLFYFTYLRLVHMSSSLSLSPLTHGFIYRCCVAIMFFFLFILEHLVFLIWSSKIRMATIIYMKNEREEEIVHKIRAVVKLRNYETKWGTVHGMCL